MKHVKNYRNSESARANQSQFQNPYHAEFCSKKWLFSLHKPETSEAKLFLIRKISLIIVIEFNNYG